MELCFECDAEADVQHHVVPASRGGSRTVPLCYACHDRAHDVSHRTLANNRFSQELEDRVCSRRRDGLTYDQIGKELGIRKCAVQRILKRYGMTTTQRGRPAVGSICGVQPVA